MSWRSSLNLLFSDFLCVVYFSQNSSSNITVQNSCFQRNLITFGMFGWDKIQTNMKFCSRDYALISRCLISSPTVRKLSKTNRFQHFPRLVHKFPMVDAPWTSWISTNYVWYPRLVHHWIQGVQDASTIGNLWTILGKTRNVSEIVGFSMISEVSIHQISVT